MAKPAKPANGNGEKKKTNIKKPLMIFGLILGLPAVGLLGWYAYTALGVVAEDKQAALDRQAAELAAKAKLLAERAKKQGFKVKHFDACTQIKEQYRIPVGVIYTEFSTRQLVGLPKSASDKQVEDRCVQFAKNVSRMERMSHHQRHVYLCRRAQFNVDQRGTYFLTSDPKGRGVLANRGGRAVLTPIPKNKFVLFQGMQIFNQGDGCLIIGMSKTGIFEFQGGIKINN